MRLVLWLYPRSWRDRYQPEMEALLGCTRLTPGVAWDLVRGALDARLRPQRPRPGAGRRDPYRIHNIALGTALAFVLVSGGLVWVMLIWSAPSRLGVAAGAALGLGSALAWWSLRRRRRGTRGPGDDPTGGASVPARPRPDAPPALAAAGRGASPGSDRRSDRE